MPQEAAATSRIGPSAAWAAIALATGVVAAVAGVRFGVLEVALGAVGLAAAVAILLAPERGLLAMLLLLPLDTAGRIITEPVTVTWFHLALLLTMGAWALARVRGTHRTAPAFTPVDAGVLLLVAAAVWSLPGSLSPGSTAMAIMRIAFITLFYFAFVTFTRDEAVADRVILVLVATAAASALLAVAQYLIPGLPIGVYRGNVTVTGAQIVRPGALFHDPNYLATFLSVAVVAAAAKAFHARRVVDSIPWLVAAAMCGAGIVVTFSRTGWVGLAAGLGVLVLSAPRSRRPALIALASLAVIGVVFAAPEAITSRVASIADVEGDASVRTRYLMVGSTVEMIGDNWVFGTGLGAYDLAYPRYRQPGTSAVTKPHQLPLAIWAEMGIPALAAELLIIGGLAWVYNHRRGRPWSPYEAFGVAGVSALLVQSLFQYYLYVEYLWLCLAFAVAATRFAGSRREVRA